MRNAITARDFLLEVANTGRPYTHDEVFSPNAPPASDYVIRRGHDWKVPVTVIDKQNVPSFVGKVALRVLQLDHAGSQPDLFVRTRLDWETPGSPRGRHMSRVELIISEQAARRLAELPLDATAEQLQDETDNQKAQWIQDYPGPPPNFTVPVDEYHQRAVRAAQQQHPELLGMLSTTFSGVVHPEALANLARWVEQNPPS